MKFFVSAAAAATLFATLASAYNGFAGPAEGEIIPAGKPYLIKWEPDTDGPVYITLRKGARTDLDTLYQIVMLEYNWGNYTWDVPADTPAGKDYAFEMKWGKEPRPEDVNYTGLFEITSGDDVKDTKSSTTTESAAETKTATESATETKTASATETDSASESSAPTSTEKDSSATETSTATGKKTSTGTKTSSGPTVTPSVKDEDSSAGVLGASAGMAAAVAFAAVAFL